MSELQLSSETTQNGAESADRGNQLRRWLPHIVIVGTWLYLCLPMMLGNTVVGFRDSANLYYPLFQAIDGVWQTSEVPLWNPYCNFGFPTVADGSSSIFYPGKLIFFFRFLGYPSRYGIYLSMHLLLAAVGAYRLARTLHCQRSGACMAGIAYAFGAPVLFQVTNVIYLVSAAWLPFALIGVWHILTRGDLRATIQCAMCCAMMILGGDPQMVYHVGLIAVASVACVAVGRMLAKPSDRVVAFESHSRWWIRRILCLSCLILVTSGLAAIQILPTEKLARRSERSGQGEIVNAYAAMASMFSEPRQGSKSISESLLHRDSQVVGQYQFSQPPWSLIELAVPNISGKPFPEHARWASQLPASDRMWFPSIYLGIAVVIISILRLRLWGRNRRDIWLSWIGLVFLLGSFGWYGLVWLIHETQLVMGTPIDPEGSWASPVGGMYWSMSTFLPKYFSFRYPAKLFIVTSLVMSVLAGRGLQTFGNKRNAIGLLVAAGALAIGAPVAIELALRDFLQDLPTNSESVSSLIEFGPFDPALAIRQLYIAIMHAAAVLASIGFVIYWVSRRELTERSSGSKNPWLAWTVVMILAVDLAIANAWLMAQVPSECFTQPVALNFETEAVPTDGKSNSPNKSPITILADPFLPDEFVESSSPNRLEEIIRWQRETLQAKHHLNRRMRLVGSFHSIWPQRYLETVESIKQSMVDHQTDASGDRAMLVWGEELNAKWQHDWNQASFEIDCDHERWVELPVFGDKGWKVLCDQGDGSGLPTRVRNDQVRISDADLLEVYLPMGKSKLLLHYQPIEFYVGAWVSTITWACTVTWLILWPIGLERLRKRRALRLSQWVNEI